MPRPVSFSFALAGAALIAASLGAPSVSLAAGQVQVTWIEPEKFADIGRGVLDRERSLRTLADHLQALGSRLPDGQSLNIEVTDVELAGELEPFTRFHQEVRVLRGRADWPRISLRYTLSQGERMLARGAADLSDPNYLYRSPRLDQGHSLAYEKRMLDDWLTSLVASADPGTGPAHR
jgi:hypothetical protein